ncbi:MAG TPA: hypothetical protein VF041_21455 [Gemmatimonadaceae bacterium]
MARRAITIVMLLVAATARPLFAQRAAGHAPAAPLAREAVALLQGHDSLPFIDSARVALVARALDAIRARFPVVADIHGADGATTLVLSPPDSAPSLFALRSGALPARGDDTLAWSAPVDSVGIAGIDSLNRAFGVDSAVVSSVGGEASLELRFARAIDVEAAGRAYERLPDVGRAGPPVSDGTSWIALVPKGRLLHFVFARGGDCSVRCASWDYYYITYDTLARAASLESVVTREAAVPDSIAYWDLPARYDSSAYRDLGDLWRALRDRRWWWRQHAVNVLGMLLGSRIGVWRDASGPRDAAYDTLATAVAGDRRHALKALAGRLADPDADVARLALAYLRDITGQDMPGGEAGARRWRAWIDEHAD